MHTLKVENSVKKDGRIVHVAFISSLFHYAALHFKKSYIIACDIFSFGWYAGLNKGRPSHGLCVDCSDHEVVRE